MNINFEKNREIMIENQLKPNKITDTNILSVFNMISKENFISKDKINICYSDQDISVKQARGYLKNLHLAQIFQLMVHRHIYMNLFFLQLIIYYEPSYNLLIDHQLQTSLQIC